MRESCIRHIPTATYRLQFNPSFGFVKVKALLPYLEKLGISTLYASPIFKARKGSPHGYDIIDPTSLNPELGNQNEFEDLVNEVHARSMTWLQDIVPNHMAFDSQNFMLMDVFEKGAASPFFDLFDIDWARPEANMKGKIIAPFLGAFYEQCLVKGEIKLGYDRQGLHVRYYDHRFPLKLQSYEDVLTHNEKDFVRENQGDIKKLREIIDFFSSLKGASSLNLPDEQRDNINHIKEDLWNLYQGSESVSQYINSVLDAYNGTPGAPGEFDLLHSLLMEQHYRLCFWKVATEEINYRRFFNINELICVRVEKEEVFQKVHVLIFNLVHEDRFDGLRIDHIDGLYNPTEYLQRVRSRIPSTYLVVEKILEMNEELPDTWEIQGTTGYDFLTYVNNLLCRRENESHFTKIYNLSTKQRSTYTELLTEKKRLIIGKHMAGEIEILARMLKEIAGGFREGIDITMYGLKRALVEVMTHFPVYRTYITGDRLSDVDTHHIHHAVGEAKREVKGLLHELEFIEKFLLLDLHKTLAPDERTKWLDFVMRFQQFTGPLMAKGFEDTLLYTYNRLISLNEVGGSPDVFGISLKHFHDFNKRRALMWRHSLNATSTHDTKRSEDVRARINVLSEIPEEWQRQVKKWSQLNRKHKKRKNGRAIPDKNDEYFLYQTLVGVYPFQKYDHDRFVERMREYIIKAVREAKHYTAWIKPDKEYEESYIAFLRAILRQGDSNEFLSAFNPFQRKIAFYGVINSLAQTLLKMTSPGIPDFYQGSELWNLALVDPDNRRPVDFDTRILFLEEIIAKAEEDRGYLIRELLNNYGDGKVKLFLIYRTLLARKKLHTLFQQGDYIPIYATGRFKEHVVAFLREYDSQTALIVVPRFVTSLSGEATFPLNEIWDTTCLELPDGYTGKWVDLLTGLEIDAASKIFLSKVLSLFPVSLLVNEVSI